MRLTHGLQNAQGRACTQYPPIPDTAGWAYLIYILPLHNLLFCLWLPKLLLVLKVQSKQLLIDCSGGLSCVVYFHQLLGAVRTTCKLVEILFFANFNLFNDFRCSSMLFCSKTTITVFLAIP